ncbi:hypothetical protein LPY66_05990 [Dehalobacter sp. DCM]|uniref:hypothetical protein n=1 Tax=Dehalobacter sp. DCM TaxID=2907827 RepID=UPI0030817996|nr:hypothetical protein LPY66_05990 [Dehalobacter sp. DCM]
MPSSKVYDFNAYKLRTKSKTDHTLRVCIICGCKHDLGCFRKKHVCLDCMNDIRKLYEEGYFTQAGT